MLSKSICSSFFILSLTIKFSDPIWKGQGKLLLCKDNHRCNTSDFSLGHTHTDTHTDTHAWLRGRLGGGGWKLFLCVSRVLISPAAAVTLASADELNGRQKRGHTGVPRARHQHLGPLPQASWPDTHFPPTSLLLLGLNSAPSRVAWDFLSGLEPLPAPLDTVPPWEQEASCVMPACRVCLVCGPSFWPVLWLRYPEPTFPRDHRPCFPRVPPAPGWGSRFLGYCPSLSSAQETLELPHPPPPLQSPGRWNWDKGTKRKG